MSDYIDLVIAKHDGNDKKFLFVAPAFSHLKKADDIVCETEKGASRATVIASVTVRRNGSEYEFIKDLTGAYEPLKKVMAKVTYIEFEWEEDNAVDTNPE